jgi:hypothetical protein
MGERDEHAVSQLPRHRAIEMQHKLPFIPQQNRSAPFFLSASPLRDNSSSTKRTGVSTVFYVRERKPLDFNNLENE